MSGAVAGRVGTAIGQANRTHQVSWDPRRDHAAGLFVYQPYLSVVQRSAKQSRLPNLLAWAWVARAPSKRISIISSRLYESLSPAGPLRASSSAARKRHSPSGLRPKCQWMKPFGGCSAGSSPRDLSRRANHASTPFDGNIQKGQSTDLLTDPFNRLHSQRNPA